MASGGTEAGPPVAGVGAGSLLISSLSSLPGLKYGTFLGGTSTLSPVFGLRPLRGSRFRSRKLPNPRSSIFSPRWSASMMLLKTVSTMTSECFFVRSDTRDTSSTSSALVMLPPGVFTMGSLRRAYQGPGSFGAPRNGRPTLPISEMVPEGCRARALAFRVRLPVRAVVVRLERANAQTDLPLLRAQLDDLHLVVVAHLQIDLLAGVRIIELRYMNQPFDALIELDEGAEVGHAR